MKKVYISTTGMVYAFPVTIKKGDKELHPFIEFGNDLKFETSTKAIQDSIEESEYFKKGKIKLFSTEQTTEDGQTEEIKAGKEKTVKPQAKQKTAHEPKAFEEVTGLQAAVEVLKSEPYKIAVKSLRTPDNVMKQAAACNVTFPNWKLD